MGKALSSLIENIFMEEFKEDALHTAAPLKFTYWHRYVDDIFVISTHGKNILQGCLNHLNSMHPNSIRFNTEIEGNNSIPLLDVKVEKAPNGKLNHSVHRKLTHTPGIYRQIQTTIPHML